MKMYLKARVWPVVLAAAIATAAGAHGYAQDTRTVTEPVFPATCTVLKAQLQIASGEPSSETAFDTTRIQSALNSCASGKAVELTTDGSNAAFLMQPITLPAGVTLLVDGGVMVFASRNPADYQNSSSSICGTNTPDGDGCTSLITATSAGSGVMGYGIINGRGNDKMLVNGTASTLNWWDVLPSGTGSQSCFEMFSGKGNNTTFYKITFLNSPYKNIIWSGTGLTVWGMKINNPYTAPNTDGVDPKGKEITITHSAISTGDDEIAIVDGSASGDITISYDNTYSGHGISVGSPTQGGLTNMLVTNINQSGVTADGSANGLRLKSSADRGGLVKNVTYQNICSRNIRNPIIIDPYYNSTPGTLLPTFQNIVYRNFHSLTEGGLQFEGYDASHITTMTLDNVIFDILKASDFNKDPTQYVTFTIGPGPVSSILQSQTGTGVSYNGSVTQPTQATYACPASNFPDLVGELYLSDATDTNQASVSIVTPATFTLNAVLQTAFSQVTYTDATSHLYTGVQAPTATVQFYEGATLVGSANLGVNGTLASLTPTGVAAGTHTYTAKYPGDTNHPAYTFGSVTVTVATPAATTTTLTLSPTTIYTGGSATATITVTSTAGTPAGTVSVLNGSTLVGSTTLSGGAATVTVPTTTIGAISLSASYAAQGSYAASSDTKTLTVVAPFTVSPTSTTLSLAPGASHTVTVTATPAGGFTGQISYSCATSVTYVTCAVSPSTGTSTTATIAVAATLSELRLPDGINWNSAGYLALLLPLGLLGWRRRGLSVLCMLLLLPVLGISGCGAGGTAAKPATPPAGPQSATVTASTTAGGILSTQTTQIMVNVTN